VLSLFCGRAIVGGRGVLTRLWLDEHWEPGQKANLNLLVLRIAHPHGTSKLTPHQSHPKSKLIPLPTDRYTLRTPIKGSPYEPVDDNLFNWKCSIKGAVRDVLAYLSHRVLRSMQSDSPYKGGTFFFKVTFSEDFLF